MIKQTLELTTFLDLRRSKLQTQSEAKLQNLFEAQNFDNVNRVKIENPLMGVCIEERPVMHWVSEQNFNQKRVLMFMN